MRENEMRPFCGREGMILSLEVGCYSPERREPKECEHCVWVASPSIKKSLSCPLTQHGRPTR
jgi:hypothetical protein